VSDPAETTRETTVAAADVAAPDVAAADVTAADVTAADGAVSSKDAQVSSYDAVPYSDPAGSLGRDRNTLRDGSRAS
jgi:hypothetical protein